MAAEYITKSKYPERQIVLDYMSAYGIRIYDYYGDGTFCMIKGDIHVDELMRLTNYKGKKRDGWVLVDMNEGRPLFKGGNLEQTYEALEYLYKWVQFNFAGNFGSRNTHNPGFRGFMLM